MNHVLTKDGTTLEAGTYVIMPERYWITMKGLLTVSQQEKLRMEGITSKRVQVF